MTDAIDITPSNEPSTAKRLVMGFAGLVSAGICAVVIAAAVVVPLPSVHGKAASIVVAPTSGSTTKICPGGLLDVVSRNGNASAYEAFATPNRQVSASPVAATSTPVSAPDDEATTPSFLPQLVSVPASGNPASPNLVAGAQSQSAQSDVISGLAVSACGDASTDQWLVGGSTEVGRNSLLLLTNPLGVEAMVSLEIFGEKGAVETPGMSNIVVAPRSQKILSLAAFAPNVVEPVVHVTTSGGQILATIQQTVTRVVTPSGVDYVQPGSAPATQQVIPGVTLTGQASQNSEGGQVLSDLAPAIRVLIPGKVDAMVTAQIIGSSGKPYIVKTKLTAGQVLQLPFLNVPDGTYTVVVSSSVPIVASARTVTSTGTKVSNAPATTAVGEDGGSTSGAQAVVTGGDFTWNASALSLSTDTLVPVPEGPSPQLTLWNSTGATASVGVKNGSGQVTTVIVPAGFSVSIPVTAQTNLQLTHVNGIYAAVGMNGVGQSSSFTLAPGARLSSPVRVYPG